MVDTPDREGRRLPPWTSGGSYEVSILIPCRDFKVSRDFYLDLGFPLKSDFDSPYKAAHFQLASTKMVLRDIWIPELAQHLSLHLLVPYVEDWYQAAQTRQIAKRYGVEIIPPEDKEWGVRAMSLGDPAGVRWHIGHLIID
jgi:catechol 2,3-dioxygenase-like lactoylglutathione lyase family enzyme